MKKNNTIIGCALFAVLICLGFDWGSKGDQKNGAASMPATGVAASGQELPFSQMMSKLSQNMSFWPSLSQENKTKAIEAVVLLYQNRQNTAILRPFDFYVKQIDQSLLSNPDFQNADLMSLVRILAVIEYDFYNGQDKDALAKEVLGEKMAAAIRTRRQQQLASPK